MNDKTIKKSKAELHEMLAEAVRNTRPAPKRTAKTKNARATGRGK